MLLHRNLQRRHRGTRELPIQWRCLIALAVLVGGWLQYPASHAEGASGVCDGAGWFVVDEAPGEGQYAIGQPGAGMTSMVPDGIVAALAWQRLLERFVNPVWTAEADATGAGFAFRLVDGDGITAVDASFGRRIELAASKTSPRGRFLVYVQGNNQASEVTVLDALTQQHWTVNLRHDAGLAAYAISIQISPDERCVAVGQVRADGSPAQSWLVDLETKAVAGPVAGFAVGWVR